MIENIDTRGENMKIIEDVIKELEKRLSAISKYNNDYELYSLSYKYLNEYLDLLNIACKNSLNFESEKTKYNEKDKDLC